MSWEDDAKIYSSDNITISLRWVSTGTVAVVTATTGPGQRGGGRCISAYGRPPAPRGDPSKKRSQL